MCFLPIAYPAGFEKLSTGEVVFVALEVCANIVVIDMLVPALQ